MPDSPYRCSVLLVDDQPGVLTLLAQQLGTEFATATATTPAEAREVIAGRPVDIVVSDLTLGVGDESGVALLEWVRHTHPRIARVLLTGTAKLEDAAEAINRCHVHRLVLKPWAEADLLAHLRAVSEPLLLERSHEHLLEEYRRLTQDLERRVKERTEELEERTRQLQVTLHELEQKNAILEKMALTDALTGLPNRRAIDLIARKELLRRTRTPAPIAVGLIDADHFKDVNSAFLLSGGDHALTWLGKTLHATIRASDSIGRVGGEEFMVVAPDTDAGGAEALAERLRATIERQHTVYHGQPIRLTVSVGFGVAEAAAAVGYDQLRELAAAALAEAKQSGRNRSVIRSHATPSLAEKG
jgi:diguanylate cyclase (GGDEF)-like protein